MIQHWIAPPHPCREAAWVPPRATQCWIDTPWMTSWVDDIMENTNCELHFKMKNISMKVADVVSFTNPPEATFHYNPIPAGYAHVLVDEVVDPYSGLQLDIPGGDDKHTLGEAIHRVILWRKDCIIFRRPPTARHPTPRRSPPPSQQTPAPPSP